mmetsp:Transcript_23138/g.46401  ORF Transcript_23138/g.46401 Transcript_23138/m.46401 type:complete len:100 (-) Transcript_23138:1961-2260(-)
MSEPFTFIVHFRGRSRNSIELGSLRLRMGLSNPQSASNFKNMSGGIDLRTSSRTIPPTNPSSTQEEKIFEAIEVLLFPSGIKLAQHFSMFPYETASGDA